MAQETDTEGMALDGAGQAVAGDAPCAPAAVPAVPAVPAFPTFPPAPTAPAAPTPVPSRRGPRIGQLQASFRLCGGVDATTARAIEQLVAGRGFSARLVGRPDGCADLTIAVQPSNRQPRAAPEQQPQCGDGIDQRRARGSGLRSTSSPRTALPRSHSQLTRTDHFAGNDSWASRPRQRGMKRTAGGARSARSSPVSGRAVARAFRSPLLAQQAHALVVALTAWPSSLRPCADT